MERRLAIVLAVATFVGIAIAIPDAHHSTFKSDHELEQQAASDLASICTLKPEKC